MKTSLKINKTANKRASYRQRSGVDSRAAKIIAKAANHKIEFVENEFGEDLRVWQKEELKAVTNKEVADALRGKAVYEEEELLNLLPPTAVKDAISRKWLVRDTRATWVLRVTTKAVTALNLPTTMAGKKLKFLDL